MNIKIKFSATFIAYAALAGCTSMAEYDAVIAKDGSFAADDRQFAVDSLNYPVFALNSNEPKQDPEVGAYKGPLTMTTDILPSDRWVIKRIVHGRYLAYSDSYGVRYCKQQLSDRRSQSFINRCDTDGQKYADFFVYVYLKRDGTVDGWQYVNNPSRRLFEKTWFKVGSKGDWSAGQPWFKCVERCDKISNMN